MYSPWPTRPHNSKRKRKRSSPLPIVESTSDPLSHGYLRGYDKPSQFKCCIKPRDSIANERKNEEGTKEMQGA